MDLDALLDASLGPALARLRETYPSVEAYFDFWRAHPAMKDSWNVYLEDYLRYDLTGEDGVLRSRVSEQAARADGRELLGSSERVGAALRGLTRPVRLLTAPAGMFGQPPGVLPPELCDIWTAQAPMLTVETVPGCQPLHDHAGPRARGDRRPPADRGLTYPRKTEILRNENVPAPPPAQA